MSAANSLRAAVTNMCFANQAEEEAFDELQECIFDILRDQEDLISTLQQRDERIVELEAEIAELRGHNESPYWGQP
jgi:hypothetical protein